MIAQATKSASYDNWHLVVNKISDLSLIGKLLVEDTIFKYYLGQKTNKTDFIDLYIRGSRVIAAERPLDIY